jgi:hypothetical protein
MPSFSMRAVVDDFVASMLPFDESVRVSHIDWCECQDAMPPTLYVDDWTVLREVVNPYTLRAGDHCIVSVNVLHKLWKWSDMLCSALTSWEVLPFRLFHHFVVLDDVASIGANGVPLRADGTPVRIAEFSDSFVNAMRRLTMEGYSLAALLRNMYRVLTNPARFHTPPLADYVHRRQPGRCGIFVVAQQLSEEQRRRTVENALTLARSNEAPVYCVFSSNCEHLAWQLDASSSYKGRFVSPQVAHNMWKAFRLSLCLVAVVCLGVLASLPADRPLSHAAFATLYHLFATVPMGAQVQACLVRTAVNLTQRRGAGDLEKGTYEYLMIKETFRAAWITIFGVGLVCVMPRLVWESEGRRFKLAAFLSFWAYNLASMCFNMTSQLCTRALLRAGVGIPMPVFHDERTQSPRWVHAAGPRGLPAPSSPSAGEFAGEAADQWPPPPLPASLRQLLPPSLPAAAPREQLDLPREQLSLTPPTPPASPNLSSSSSSTCGGNVSRRRAARSRSPKKLQ